MTSQSLENLSKILDKDLFSKQRFMTFNHDGAGNFTPEQLFEVPSMMKTENYSFHCSFAESGIYEPSSFSDNAALHQLIEVRTSPEGWHIRVRVLTRGDKTDTYATGNAIISCLAVFKSF